MTMVERSKPRSFLSDRSKIPLRTDTKAVVIRTTTLQFTNKLLTIQPLHHSFVVICFRRRQFLHARFSTSVSALLLRFRIRVSPVSGPYGTRFYKRGRNDS